MTRHRQSVTGIVLAIALAPLLASCAQPPTKELEITRKRVAAAIEMDAALFAPELLEEAETFLADAEHLARDRATYRSSIRAAAHACVRADEAFEKASGERRIAVVRLQRLMYELDGLLDMAASRGAVSSHAEELARLRARYEAVRGIVNVLTAWEEASALKPELLAFERRVRVSEHGDKALASHGPVSSK